MQAEQGGDEKRSETPDGAEEQAKSGLEALRAQIAELADRAPAGARAGHSALGADIWLSTDPAGRATLACQGREAGGFSLALTEGDSGGWAALGLRLPAGALSGARYLGLMVEAKSPTPVTFTPTLRTPAGDTPAPEPMIATPTPRARLAWFPLDPAHREGSCEINIFFHDDTATLDILRLEPLAMV